MEDGGKAASETAFVGVRSGKGKKIMGHGRHLFVSNISVSISTVLGLCHAA